MGKYPRNKMTFRLGKYPQKKDLQTGEISPLFFKYNYKFEKYV